MNIRRLLSLGALLVAALGAGACGGTAPPVALAPVASDTLHALRPGDVIKVMVFGHDELSGEFPVDENGNLLLPIVGEFSVADMSINDLRARIRREFGQLYTQSFVSVTPTFRVSVLGEVIRPGLYSVDPTMTVYEVLATAGGTTRNAKEGGMRLIRGGMQMSVPVDAGALARATLREIGIRSGDQIYVPRKSVTYETWLVVLQVFNLGLLAYSIFR